MITGQWTFGLRDFEGARLVRDCVFVQEQGYAPEDEFDEMDFYAWHALVMEDDEPVATGRIYLWDGAYTIGRVCVRKEYRGRHLGDLIMRLLLDRAQQAGAPAVRLRAQLYAVPFYEQYGFAVVGEPSRQEGERTDHVEMQVQAQDIRLCHSCESCATPCESRQE